MKLKKKHKPEVISSIFSDHNTERLDINYREKSRQQKHMEVKQLNSEYQQITEEFKKEIKIHFETSDNESTTQNLSDALNAVLRGKFIAIQAYLRKQEKHQINNLNLHLQQLEKEEQQQQQKIKVIRRE